MVQTKKLSLAELKANSTNKNVVANMDAIKGGFQDEWCHCVQCDKDALIRQVIDVSKAIRW